MFRLRRTIGWLFLVVVAIFLVSLLGANLYVQSQATQERIQQELSQRLGMPLRIQRISVTPWGGLKLSGITIPQANPGSAPPFLEAQNFHLRVRLRTIIWRPLVIKEVALIKPTVVWPQNESGKWRLPMTLRPPEPLPPLAAKKTPAASNHATTADIETSPFAAGPPSTTVMSKSDAAAAPQVRRA